MIANGGIEVVVFFLCRISSCLPGGCVCSPTTFAIVFSPKLRVKAFTSHLNCGKLCGNAHLQVVTKSLREHRTFVNSYCSWTSFN